MPKRVQLRLETGKQSCRVSSETEMWIKVCCFPGSPLLQFKTCLPRFICLRFLIPLLETPPIVCNIYGGTFELLLSDFYKNIYNQNIH